MKDLTFMSMEFQKERRKRAELKRKKKKVFREIMTKNFSYVVSSIHL